VPIRGGVPSRAGDRVADLWHGTVGLSIVASRKYAMNPLLKRISINPQVCFGKPCIRGTRIWVSLILDQLAGGTPVEELLNNYPQLTREDILAAIAYGAEASRERIIPIPTAQVA
jgi:uncharacterized protein (DUF433 family)